ncbi:MAG: hypothetical protein R8G33_06895 [Gammaproteobacteria bacterium]|nr:hypothetical protein [Gammaproteobacteria bacterium]
MSIRNLFLFFIVLLISINSTFAAQGTITIDGTLSLLENDFGEGDTANLEGAQLNLVFTYDTAAIPSLTQNFPDQASARYDTAERFNVTGRPNMASDLQFQFLPALFSGGLYLESVNRFTDPFGDSFRIRAFAPSFEDFIGDFGFGGPFINFNDVSFFPGTDVPNLLFLETIDSDITNLFDPVGFQQLLGYEDQNSGAFLTYSLLNATVTNTVIPVPAAIWLFGSALIFFGLIGRQKYS